MAVSIPAVHAVSLLQFAPYLAEHDVDVLAFFSRQGLSPNIFQLHDSWLPRDLCLRLSSALAEETGLPVHIADDPDNRSCHVRAVLASCDAKIGHAAAVSKLY